MVQFIITTHSPSVILGSSSEAVFYSINKDEGGNTSISKQQSIKEHFLNDISSSIFNFDINDERINHPTISDKEKNKKAKKALLKFIDTSKGI